MSEDLRRLTRQDADLDQTNNQKTDQTATQDASHHSDTRQDLAVRTHQSQVDQQKVTVTVQNHLGASAVQSAAGRLEGRVLDTAGMGIVDCVVEVFFGPLMGIPVAVEETDRLGRFQVADLPPGFYSLRAVAPDGTAAEQWNLRLDVGGECRTQLCLPTVLNRRGRDLSVYFSHR